MQYDFATTAAQTDIPRVSAARSYGTKNWNETRTKELPKRKSNLLRITTKNKDQILDQNNGLEAKISKEETITTITMDLGGIYRLPTIVSFQGQTSHMGTTVRTTDGHMINVKISHSIEATEIDPEMDLSTIRVGTRETIAIFPVLQRLKRETPHKKFISPIKKWST